MDYFVRPLTYKQTAEIYSEYLHRHFPAGEIKPLKSIARMWEGDAYRAYALYAGSDSPVSPRSLPPLAGYAFFAAQPGGGMILLDYLAILEEYRSRGAGSAFLRALSARLPNCRGILIETEDIDFAQNEAEARERQKRDAFYEKNGVLKTEIRSSVYGVHYAIWLLALGGNADREECEQNLRDIYRIMVPGEKFEKYVEIRRSQEVFPPETL